MEFTSKRSERELMNAVEDAKARNLSPRRISNLQATLDRKRAEKKAGRIEAAHKRWATRKTNIAARTEQPANEPVQAGV